MTPTQVRHSSTRGAVLAAALLIAGCRDTSSARPDATATTHPAVRTPVAESMTPADVLEPLWLLSPTAGACHPSTVPPGDLALFLELLGLAPTPPDDCGATR